jgi:hypothetical protein
MTLLWFIVWLISDHVGSHEPLLQFDPANVWAMGRDRKRACPDRLGVDLAQRVFVSEAVAA